MALPISERSIAYGDGLFTTAKISAGKIEFLNAHINRLEEGAKRLAIDISLSGLEQHLIELAKSYDLAVLKVIITAGEGGRGYSRINTCSQKILITVHTFPAHYGNWQDNGISIGIAQTQLGINPALAGLKHLNRLEQVMVRNELDQREEDDLLVQDCAGQVVEASAANVFWKEHQSNIWQTPALDTAGVNGVMRQHILNTLSNCRQVNRTPQQLDNIEAMFICNAVMGIVPVANFDGLTLTLVPIIELKEYLAC